MRQGAISVRKYVEDGLLFVETSHYVAMTYSCGHCGLGGSRLDLLAHIRIVHKVEPLAGPYRTKACWLTTLCLDAGVSTFQVATN